MKLSIMSAIFAGLGFEAALAKCQGLGLDAIELPCGPYPGDPWGLGNILEDAPRLAGLKELLVKYGLTVSGIAVHGNVVHPDKTVAAIADTALRNGIKLAKEFGCVVIAFSGCPAGCATDAMPNFIVSPWPNEHLEMSKYQWERVLIPYWTEINTIAAAAGVKIAIESHPNMTVHNPMDVVRLHVACGPNIGANFDMSHWCWQGIDPIKAAAYLASYKCLFYVHAKDARLNTTISEIRGVMDPGSFAVPMNRSWIFCTVGVGHDISWWAQLMGTFAACGYDGPISLEHEDANMGPDEGIQKGLAVLKQVVIRDCNADMRWAK